MDEIRRGEPEHASRAGSGGLGSLGQIVRAGNLELDAARREVRLDDELLSLKPREFDLLLYFARNPGVVLTRDALLREVWGYDFPVDTRTVDVHVRWLREKIERDPSTPSRITTVRGHGYRFAAGER